MFEQWQEPGDWDDPMMYMEYLHEMRGLAYIQRPTELRAMVKAYLTAKAITRRQTYNGVDLVSRNTGIILTAQQALEHGIGNLQGYVALQVGVSQSTVSRVLSAAVANDVFYSAYLDVSPLYSYSSELPDERAIQNRMFSMERACAGKGMPQCEGSVRGRNELCWPCYKRFGVHGERPEWLEFLIRDIRRETRQRAIDSLREGGSIFVARPSKAA